MIKVFQTMYDRHLRKWSLRHNGAVLGTFATYSEHVEWIKNGTEPQGWRKKS